ncbi:HAMP domain-containing histidine kinase [Allostreptomyces psammosilenae]|uniref:Signal transduction histidine-protein kinase/phosphatase MprB n=1 Tax=Allostreptomyces psammosilenae TaxID=1892865 RepID=A0A853A6N2_9ACTN|nr:HAMP domain-containing histidine kinase [Allostreptomyces psammosilenae]NYI06132.1 signal transduction histidine kinase [Allostreptomyces psammosilenae]
MRRRLINSTLSVVLVVVAVFGLPLLLLEARSIQSTAHDALRTEAVRLAQVAEVQIAAGQPLDLTALKQQSVEGHYAEISVPGRETARIGQPPGGSTISAREEIPGGGSVVVLQSGDQVRARLIETLLLVLVIGGLAVIAAVVLAVRLADRAVRPLLDLAETAERLGSGDPRPRMRRYGVPELDRVAEVLDVSAERIRRMLTTERRLSADASHQLRTPLTALTMRLEEIIATDDPDTVKEEAAIALHQVERLTDVVQRLLTNSREFRDGATAFDLDTVIQQQLDEWRPAYRSQDRPPIRLEGERHLSVVARPGAVAQVLATLIENALLHGGGEVTLRTRLAGSSAVVEVADEGTGVAPELGARVFERAVSGYNSTGLGLAVARDLAEADGGRLELLQERPPVFALFLARGNAAPAETAPAPQNRSGKR